MKVEDHKKARVSGDSNGMFYLYSPPNTANTTKLIVLWGLGLLGFFFNLATSPKVSSLEKEYMGGMFVDSKYYSCFGDNNISKSFNASSEDSQIRLLYRYELLKEVQKPA